MEHTKATELSRAQRLRYVLILGGLTAFGPLTIDLYLPAFPAIVTEFSTTQSAVQLTLTGTTIGFGLGQLIIGPWSDAVGRRLPLLLATILHVAASIVCAVAPSVPVLIAARVLMGCAASASGVVSLAMVRDLFSGRPMARMIANLSVVNGIAPIGAPLLGAQILLLVQWRGIFVVLACYGALICLATAIWLKETLPRQLRNGRTRSGVVSGFRALGRDRAFVGIVLTGGMIWASQFSYLQGSSFVLQGEFGLSTGEYGVVYAILATGYVFGIQLGSRLSQRLQPRKIIGIATIAMAASAGVVLIVPWQQATLGWLYAALWAFQAAMAATAPCLNVLALTPHGNEAGTAAALLGAGNFIIAGAVSPLVGIVPGTGTVPMATVMLGSAILAVCAYQFVARPRRLPEFGS